MSNNYGEPDWATPGATSEVTTTTQDALSGGAITAPETGEKDNSKFIIALFSLIDMGLAGMMGALGVLEILDFSGNNIDDVAEVFLSTYMIIFALLLLIYELMWWKAIPFLNRILRKNFGFMYGLKGKGFYMIFIAFLTIGLRGDNHNRALTLATGISFLAVGFAQVFVVCTNPAIADAYKPPTSGLTSSTTGDGSSPV